MPVYSCPQSLSISYSIRVAACIISFHTPVPLGSCSPFLHCTDGEIETLCGLSLSQGGGAGVFAAVSTLLWRSCSVVSDICNPIDCSHQAPLFMGFFRQEYWSGLPCPPPGDLPNPGTELPSLMSPSWADGFSATSTTWEAHVYSALCYTLASWEVTWHPEQ